MQIERKTHSPVTIRFPDYSFNEHILSLVFLIIPFLMTRKNVRKSLL